MTRSSVSAGVDTSAPSRASICTAQRYASAADEPDARVAGAKLRGKGAGQDKENGIMRLTRQQADIVAPGAWLTTLVTLAFFARPALIGGAVVATLVIGIYYAARDAAGVGND